MLEDMREWVRREVIDFILWRPNKHGMYLRPRWFEEVVDAAHAVGGCAGRAVAGCVSALIVLLVLAALVWFAFIH